MAGISTPACGSHSDVPPRDRHPMMCRQRDAQKTPRGRHVSTMTWHRSARIDPSWPFQTNGRRIACPPASRSRGGQARSQSANQHEPSHRQDSRVANMSGCRCYPSSPASPIRMPPRVGTSARAYSQRLCVSAERASSEIREGDQRVAVVKLVILVVERVVIALVLFCLQPQGFFLRRFIGRPHLVRRNRRLVGRSLHSSRGPSLPGRCPRSAVLRPRPTPQAAAMPRLPSWASRREGHSPVLRSRVQRVPVPTCRPCYPGRAPRCID